MIKTRLDFRSPFAVSGRPIMESHPDRKYLCGPFEMEERFLKMNPGFDWHLHIARSFHACLCGTMERFMKKT